MFGQGNQPTFGTGGFGSTPGSTGTPFGQTSGFGNTGFGTSTFGSATPGFGTPAATGFGSSTTGGLFGSGQASTGFGSAANTSGFGTGTQTGTGLFGIGTNTQPGGTMFGTPTASTSFGAKPAGFGGFGTSTSTGGGLFGTQHGAGSTLFGTPATSTGAGLFGSTGATGLFGSSTPVGTTVKFNAPASTDTTMKNGVSTNINTRHQCITAMKEYEAKCLEELRVEDYLANRKSGTASALSGSSLFGRPTTSVTTQSTGFSFGQPKPAFGATGFGTSTSSTGGLFGQTTQSNTLFGGQNKLTFGTTTTTSTGFSFGTTTTTVGGGLFGQQNKPLFGGTSTGGTGLFGTSQATPAFGQTGTSAFGQTGGGLFGQQKPFGTATTQAGLSFGATPASGGLFGKPGSTAPTFGFGQTASQGSAFSKPLGFGSTTTTASQGFGVPLFGTGNTSTGGLFGGTAAKPAFSFGGATGAPAFGTGASTGLGTSLGMGFGTGNTFGAASNLSGVPGANFNQGQQMGNISHQAQMQLLNVALATSPYGDSELFRNVLQDQNKREELLKPTNPAAQRALASAAYKVSPRPTAKVKPKFLDSSGRSSLFDGLDEEDYGLSQDSFVPRRSVKKLVIGNKNRSIPRSPDYNMPVASPGLSSAGATPAANLSSLTVDINAVAAPSEIALGQQDTVPKSSKDQAGKQPPSNLSYYTNPISKPIAETPKITNQDTSIADLHNTIVELNQGLDDLSQRVQRPKGASRRLVEISQDESRDVSIPDTDSSVDHLETFDNVPPHPTGIVSHRPGYYTIPSMEELADMVDENGDCFVENFSIGREGYGSVFFPGTTNVAGLNLDKIVHFRRKEVTIYPDETGKPPEGEELNKKAEVTLHAVWPNDKTTKLPIKDHERLQLMGYQEKLERATAKLSAVFVDYRAESGSWVFQVKHFSKYGLEDSDEDELTPEELNKRRELLKAQKQLLAEKLQSNIPKKGTSQQKEASEIQNAVVENGEITRDQLIAEDDLEMADVSKDFVLDKFTGITDEKIPEDMVSMQDHSTQSKGQYQSPNSYPIEALGVNAHRLQVMKASFFQDMAEEEQMDMGFEDDKRYFDVKRKHLGGVLPRSIAFEPLVAESSIHASGDTSSILQRSYQLSSKVFDPPDTSPLMSRRFKAAPQYLKSNLPEMEPHAYSDHPLIPSGMPVKLYKVVGARRQPELAPLEHSICRKKHLLLADAGLFMGRAFRVAWAPGLVFTHMGSNLGNSPTDKLEDFGQLPPVKLIPQPRIGLSSFTVTIEKLATLHDTNTLELEITEKHLAIHLANSVSSVENGNCPFFLPKQGVDSLHEYANLCHDLTSSKDVTEMSFIHRVSLVWDLCCALWGNIPGVLDPLDDTVRVKHECHVARREAFSKWLSSTANSFIQRQTPETGSTGHVATMFNLMTAGHISTACKTAQNVGDHRLALLLSQPLGSPVVRNLLHRQLNEWAEVKGDRFIEHDRLKIYALLSGTLVWPSAQDVINTCAGLDWKRALALHLWYQCSSWETIEIAVHQYEKAFLGDSPFGPYTAPPIPDYLARLYTKSSKDEKPEKLDTCYHLLKLYSDHTYDMENVLNPTAFSPDHLDFRVSWHMYMVLRSVGYSHLSDYHQCQLHQNYADQLETCGQWHWAAFVLLHIPNASRREKCMKHLLSKHVQLDSEEEYIKREEFLLNQLEIPDRWLHEAKAVKAKYEHRPHEEAWHLLKAGMWNDSHTVVLEHLAAEAVINDNREYLLDFLGELAEPERSSHIRDWNIGGKVFLDFLLLTKAIEDIRKDQEPSAAELERLYPEITSLCNRLSNLQCRNSKDRLCQSEMAKQTSQLMRCILSLQHEEVPTRLLAPHLGKLPMPEDYSLEELQALTRSYTLEMTK